jgi:hypothetical protein
VRLRKPSAHGVVLPTRKPSSGRRDRLWLEQVDWEYLGHVCSSSVSGPAVQPLTTADGRKRTDCISVAKRAEADIHLDAGVVSLRPETHLGPTGREALGTVGCPSAAFSRTVDLVPLSAFGGGVAGLPTDDIVLSAMAFDAYGTATSDDLGKTFGDGATIYGNGQSTISALLKGPEIPGPSSPTRNRPWMTRRLLSVFRHRLPNLFFHCIQVEGCALLHGRIIDGGHGELRHFLLHKHEAPELVHEPAHV